MPDKTNKKNRQFSFLSKIMKNNKAKRKGKVEITTRIEKMDCVQSKDDKSVLVCDIVASGEGKEIKKKIAIQSPRLKFIEVITDSGEPEYYYKEIEIDDEGGD